jgi:hypothetical protein
LVAAIRSDGSSWRPSSWRSLRPGTMTWWSMRPLARAQAALASRYVRMPPLRVADVALFYGDAQRGRSRGGQRRGQWTAHRAQPAARIADRGLGRIHAPHVCLQRGPFREGFATPL